VTESRHLDDGRLAALAAGSRPTPGEGDHLLGCAACRGALAQLDPSALLGLLAVAPVAAPAQPLLARTEARRAGAGPVRRLLVASAAAGLAAAALLVATLAPPPAGPVVAERGPAPVQESPPRWPSVVDSVQSPTARVVALVPPSADGPTVTLILDEEFDL
jgi:hypothetical protein